MKTAVLLCEEVLRNPVPRLLPTSSAGHALAASAKTKSSLSEESLARTGREESRLQQPTDAHQETPAGTGREPSLEAPAPTAPTEPTAPTVPPVEGTAAPTIQVTQPQPAGLGSSFDTIMIQQLGMDMNTYVKAVTQDPTQVPLYTFLIFLIFLIFCILLCPLLSIQGTGNME